MLFSGGSTSITQSTQLKRSGGDGDDDDKEFVSSKGFQQQCIACRVAEFTDFMQHLVF